MLPGAGLGEGVRGRGGGGHNSLARWLVHASDSDCAAVRRTGEIFHNESSIPPGLEDEQEVLRFLYRWRVKPNRGGGLLLGGASALYHGHLGGRPPGRPNGKDYIVPLGPLLMPGGSSTASGCVYCVPGPGLRDRVPKPRHWLGNTCGSPPPPSCSPVLRALGHGGPRPARPAQGTPREGGQSSPGAAKPGYGNRVGRSPTGTPEPQPAPWGGGTWSHEECPRKTRANPYRRPRRFRPPNHRT